ncbi:hypothetical protein BLNAU_14355 [Blattamonas nauphoetae]|uniref:Uncharacterized protein n=1 Tax=Blattamonas nauphoetae TaxID=2049346 RepID=A0ABQ9XH10_9EUKA|nr:hypothetical protein BLNAU_14355 [Blattamonas nauphoetae]
MEGLHDNSDGRRRRGEDNGLEKEEQDSEEMVEDGVNDERSERDENNPEMSSTPAQNDTFESSSEPKPLNSDHSSLLRLDGRGRDSPYNHSDVYSGDILPSLTHYNSSTSYTTGFFSLNQPTQPPVETKTDFGFGQFTARSLLTQRDEDDDHQTRRDDAEWEEAFENAVEDLIAGHKTIHSGIPIVTKIIMVSHVVLVFGLLVGYMVPNNFSFNSFTDSVDNILLAAIRPICLTNSNFFLLNLAFDMPFLVFPKLITHPTNSASCRDNDQSVSLIDARTITRFDNDFNIEQLLVPGDNCMTDKASCIAEPIHERLHESHDTLYGEFLKEEDESQFNENHPIFHFMNSALRKDLREGTMSMMKRMCKDCGADKDIFMSNRLIIVVVLVVAYFFLRFVMIQPYVIFKRMRLEDRRLDELISFDTDDGNYIRVIRMHEQHESAGMQETAMDVLMKATKRAFREEEQNMVDRLKAGGKTSSLTNEQIDSHKLEHRVMIQRLGIIFDGLRRKDLARQAISVRHQTRLFDRHFITSDLCDLTSG